MNNNKLSYFSYDVSGKQLSEGSLVNVEPQVGPNDCGLFCVAYDQMLAYRRDPSEYNFNQARMRQTFSMYQNIEQRKQI
ncbi:hypothetical protein BpHYR1_011543 [Brachionus plicatilis]|uniref:Ubiquitin-like protease family profile domain-containing protein n=1 Tax=Brachionus plicatilis TaxID=10195 RepID=A0A3M7QZ74_BRAPC|nr:hypothetical protein BpHYR1_011543 [Brachionus plicatilis]